VSKNPTIGSVNDILVQISQLEVSNHNLLIHPDIEVFREIYSRYIKRQLEDRKEVVPILPYYKTEDKVRRALSASFMDIQEMGNDKISKYEKEGSLVIKDSIKVYSSSDNIVLSLIQGLVKRAENLAKNGVTVIADLGSFYHNNHLGDTQRLVDYELSLPSRYNDALKLKGLYIYHKEDFEKDLQKNKNKSYSSIMDKYS
jgi:hypothetical protein